MSVLELRKRCVGPTGSACKCSFRGDLVGRTPVLLMNMKRRMEFCRKLSCSGLAS